MSTSRRRMPTDEVQHKRDDRYIEQEPAAET